MKKIALLTLLLTFTTFSLYAQNRNYQLQNSKLHYLMERLNDQYVDTVNFDKLVEKAIVEMLKELDPHSTYIAKKDVEKTNEPLEGKFDGIGVTFQMIKDTINIMEVLVGGPSEKVGLLPGDKIIKVDTEVACGKNISNSWVQSHLRGKKGTKVQVWVKRGRNPEPLAFTIVRDKIPMNSINVSYMVDEEVGYIRLERFARTSPQEFAEAMSKLKAQGMKSLIFDLRGNGGGYLDVAFSIADQFIKDGNMIVYTDNFRKTGQQFKATGKGDFEKGKLVVLVDEGSASASEIVTGAIQDWDRGIVMGRRTFGKGLVQKPMYLPDGSMVRLTISHYYTPTGRCIQKPYDDGLESYYSDLRNRQTHGEYLTADSISFPDSLKYYTPKGRLVYGGGGIMPDIFVPVDTTKYSTLYNEIMRKGVFGNYTMAYMEDHRAELKQKYPTMADFKRDFVITDDFYADFMDFAKKEGVKDSVTFIFSSNLENFVKKNKTKLDSIYASYDKVSDPKQNYAEMSEMIADYMHKSYDESVKLRNADKAPAFIKEYLKFEMARTLYGYGEAYQIFLLSDDTFAQACKVIKDEKFFKHYKVDR
ncbi:MAG: S41 family peptidase [Bacteroidales bacterium]|nr:S41 family peptidase [Bacteroidales bacterium]